MTPEHANPPDPTYGFVREILWVMLGLWAIMLAVGLWRFPGSWSGLLSGGALAVALYLIAIRAGTIFLRTRRFGPVMTTLLVSQLVIWGGMAVLLAVLKVHPIGFVIGVSCLPLAVVLTLIWRQLRGMT